MVLIVSSGVSSSPAREVTARSSMIQAREKSFLSVICMSMLWYSSQSWTMALDAGFPALADKIFTCLPFSMKRRRRLTIVGMSRPYGSPGPGNSTSTPSKSNPTQYLFIWVPRFWEAGSYLVLGILWGNPRLGYTPCQLRCHNRQPHRIFPGEAGRKKGT
jgi:hypothetical protein